MNLLLRKLTSTHLVLDTLVDHVRDVGETKDEVLKARGVPVPGCCPGLGSMLRRHLRGAPSAKGASN